jgi:hypothetical protein
MRSSHPNIKDLTGQIFGRLIVIEIAGCATDGHIRWVCQCSCGGRKIANSNSLRAGQVKSCGCLNKDAAAKRITAHGVWNKGKSYAVQNGNRCYKTKHGWAKAVIRKYGNKCQICNWDKAKCDAHHKIAKAKGGLHTIENGIVLCPNCHRLQHELGDVD